MRILRLASLLLALIATLPVRAEPPVRILAAVSTTNVLTEVIQAFTTREKIEVIPVFAASSALAKQVENGAPANLFLSADERWMDYLSDRRLIVASSRADLLGSRLVLIAPADSMTKLVIAPGFPLAAALGDGRLAVGDPDHVPAGAYAKAALESLKVWPAVEGKLARTDSVRGVLAFVERGEAPFGIVYSTDAAISRKVRIVGEFPEASHPPVRYPVALVAGQDGAAARTFLTFLRSAEARAIFQRHGFAVF